jgi:hypothetical protein
MKMPHTEHNFVIFVPNGRWFDDAPIARPASGFCFTIGPFPTRELAQTYLDESEAPNCHLLEVLAPVEGGGSDDADLNP